MSRLLFIVITAMIAVITPLEGFPTEDPTSPQDQVTATEANQEDEKTQGPVAMDVNGAGAAAGSPSGDDDDQVISTTTVESVDTCTTILSRVQVQDIQFQQSDMLYIVINGQVIARENPLDLFIGVFRIVSQMIGTTDAIDVWLSKAPCPACIDYLELIFNSFRIKPVLHVESLDYIGSNYEVLRDLGCLAKLTTRAFHLKAWDWDVFRETYGPSCDYYSTDEHSTEYTTQKIYTKTLLDYLEDHYTRSALVNLCYL